MEKCCSYLASSDQPDHQIKRNLKDLNLPFNNGSKFFLYLVRAILWTKVCVCGFSFCRDCGFESCRWHGCLSLENVVCCKGTDHSSRKVLLSVVCLSEIAKPL